MDILPAGHMFAGLQRNAYRCFAVDAPHRFVAGTKGGPQHYNRMTDQEIASMPVADLVHPDGAWLFFWTTSPKLYAPLRTRTQLTAQQIAHHWGFRWSARAFVWIKLKASLGKGGSDLLFLPRDCLHF